MLLESHGTSSRRIKDSDDEEILSGIPKYRQRIYDSEEESTEVNLVCYKLIICYLLLALPP